MQTEDLNKQGIYKISNLKTGKWYVGSVTSSTFKIRFKRHLNLLLSGKHENAHLQRSFNKHGIDNFRFEILEILKENILLREQYYLDNFFKELYNINKFANKPPCYSQASKETKLKRAASIKIFHEKALVFFNLIKEEKLSISEVPIYFRQWVSSKLEHTPWNKGLTNKEIDYSFLKGVKKTISEKFLYRAQTVGKAKRLKSKQINVYDYSGTFLKVFNSVSDIVDYSKHNNDLLMILIRENQDGILGFNNIKKVLLREQLHHKGLIFRYVGEEQDVRALQPKEVWHKFKSFKQCRFYQNGRVLEQSDNENSVNSVNT